ncbi:AAA family ATPase [Pseudolysinimonas sp.]|uniref:AAA family ATPase n=1 Tax=Pseudolysinimonas sp. TaxID=2680009 RepID=UPI003F7D78A5
MTDTTAAPEAAPKLSLAALADVLGAKTKNSATLGKPSCMAFMGEPGTGKSTLLGGIIKVPAYKDAKVAYVDVENGTDVWALDPQITHAVETGQIQVINIDKTDPMTSKPLLDQLLGYTDANGQKHVGALLSDSVDVDVIALDTFSTLQEIGLAYFMATCKTTDGRQDPLAAYGALATWTNDILWALQNGRPLGLVSSHTMEKKDKKTGIDKMTMKLAGSAKDNVAAIPDLVAHIGWEEREDEEPRYSHLVANMSQSPYITVKNRYGFTEPFWDFSLPSLFAAIDEKIAGTHAVIAAVTKSTSK